MNCLNCNEIFETRNKLFKHLKICLKNQKNENEIENENEYLKKLKNENYYNINNYNDNKLYVYVVGGRLRGRTLCSVHKYNIQENKWELCQSMLDNRGSHGSIFINGILYAIGGGGLHSNLSSCETFDGIEWQRSSPLNVSRHALTITSIENKIYAIGGWVDGTLCSNVVEVLDTTLDSPKWNLLPSLQLSRRLHGATSYNSKLYVFGGSCDDPHWHTNTVEVFDTLTDSSWTTLPTRLPASGSTSAVTIYPYIYVFLHGKYVCRYDPQLDTYTTLSNLPVYDWHCFDVKTIPITNEHDNEYDNNNNETNQIWPVCYVMGGASNGKWGPFSYRYNILTDTWTELASIPQSKRRVACAVVREPFRRRIENLNDINNSNDLKEVIESNELKQSSEEIINNNNNNKLESLIENNLIKNNSENIELSSTT